MRPKNKKTRMNGQTSYPIADAIPQDLLDQEAQKLESLKQAPLFKRMLGYLQMGGPGFMSAALTLGAGTLTAAMLSGARFGYKTLWLIWVSMGLGLFMMAAMVRFSCRGGFRVIPMQNRRHGWFVGSLLTALIGTAAVAIIFNFGQYGLGSHLMESLTPHLGFEFPRQVNWIIYMAITVWITLNYGQKGQRGTKLVENFMKGCIGLMLICFAACLFLVGVDWKAAGHGLFIPWLPAGGKGLDLFIAASAAAVGVIDWVFIHYAGLARGWKRNHEGLARFDILWGLFIPFILINFLVMGVFAKTLYPLGLHPESAPELAQALTPLLGHTWSQILFYLGFLAVPITTTVGMSLACAMAIHEAFDWEPDTSSWHWRMAALLPQIGFLGVWYPNPVWFIIIISAFLCLSNNIVGWSMYLLLNDQEVLGEDRSRSFLWNLGIILQITLLNCIAIIYVFNRLGWWVS